MLDLVDTHVHFWDLKNKINDWVSSEAHINQDFLPKNYLQRINHLFSPNKVVVIEAANSHNTIDELEWLQSINQGHQLEFRYIPFIDMLTDSNSFITQLSLFKKYKNVSGFRHILAHDRYQCYSPMNFDFSENKALLNNFINNLIILSKNKYIFELQMYPEQLIKIHPQIIDSSINNLVIEHCGLPTIEEDVISSKWFEMVELYKNIAVFKLSGIELTNAQNNLEKIIIHLISKTQTMFGSNLPISELENLQKIIALISTFKDTMIFNANNTYR